MVRDGRVVARGETSLSTLRSVCASPSGDVEIDLRVESAYVNRLL